MSWLISLILGGMMFASDAGQPVQYKINNVVTDTAQIVRQEETERFEQTYPLSANGKVSVSNVNGSITVEAWDRNEVKLVAVKTADSREHLADVDIRIDAKADSLRVEADFDSSRRRNGQNRNYGRLEVQFHLDVPRGAVLDEIETVNGGVNVSNTTNFTKISAVNGEVRAANLSGTADISTVNGTAEADFSSLQTGSRISLSTVNGRVNLLIPSDADATIKADTTNGKILNDFGLPVNKGQYVGRNLYGKIGNGDVKIKLESVNGELAVRRRQDGKTASPAINLLPQKSNKNSDSDDEDYDSESISKTTNKSVKEAVKAVQVEIPEINVDIEKAMAQAQKEIAKSQMNSAKMQQQMRQAMAQQKEAFARMRVAGWFAGSPAIEKKSDSYAVKGTPKVTVEARNCEVVVRGWDKSEVQYSVMRLSRMPNQAPLQPVVEHNESAVNIKIAENGGENRQFFDQMSKARIEVFVPKKSNLRIVTEREIRLENVSGEIDLQGADESVNVRDADGTLSVATASGQIRVIGFRGAFDARTNDGMMNLEGDFQKLSAQTADGAIILTLPENADSNIESNRKDVTADGLSLVSVSGEKNASVWKVGKGGENLKLYASGDGRLFVRSASILK